MAYKADHSHQIIRSFYLTKISTYTSLIDTLKNSQKTFINRIEDLKNKQTASVNFLIKSSILQFSATQAWFVSKIFSFLGGSSAPLVAGLLFGGNHDLPPSVRHNLKVTGMQHVIAASGYNVSLMLSTAALLFSRFSARKISALGLIVSVICYVCLAGAVPSLVRAGGMAVMAIVGKTFCRVTNPGWALFCIALLMVLYSREYLGSISFQLSISSTLGIVALMPRVEDSSWLQKIELAEVLEVGQAAPGKNSFHIFQAILEYMKEVVVIWFAAQAFTLPLLLFHFGEYSLLSLPANILLSWLTPLVTLGSLWLLLLSLLIECCGLSAQILLALPWKLIEMSCDFFFWCLELVAQLPGGFIELPTKGSWAVVAMWWLMLGWWLRRPRPQRQLITWYHQELP